MPNGWNDSRILGNLVNASMNQLPGAGDKVYSAFDALFGGQRREERAYNERIAAQQLQWANTAHQREVADLKAAGLNPWLSAQGAGADTPTIDNGSASALQAAKGGTDLLKTLAMTALAIVALI